MGYKGLEGVRQGKYFELDLEAGLNRAEAEAEIALHRSRSSHQSRN